MLKLYLTVLLSLVIEASLESYFQFWMQANFSLPNFLIFVLDVKFLEVTNIEQWRIFSILFSFISISLSIIKIWLETVYIIIHKRKQYI